MYPKPIGISGQGWGLGDCMKPWLRPGVEQNSVNTCWIKEPRKAQVPAWKMNSRTNPQRDHLVQSKYINWKQDIWNHISALQKRPTALGPSGMFSHRENHSTYFIATGLLYKLRKVRCSAQGPPQLKIHVFLLLLFLFFFFLKRERKKTKIYMYI